MVYGNLICQNGIHEIIRCIESVYPIVDEYYVVDGGSDDGTYELLEKYKDVYNIKLFRHKFESMDKQRNWLLNKTPKGWVVSIDQDEKLTMDATKQMKSFMGCLEVKETELPTVIAIPLINLNGDILHHMEDPIRYNLAKIFYNDGCWYEGGYHSYLTKGHKEQISQCFYAPDSWAILHYAWLNPDRKKNLQKDVETGKRDYKEFEDILNNNKNIPL